MIMLGASAVWIGTRFILCDEAGSSQFHRDAVRSAGHGEIIRSVILSGRPINSRATPYLRRWEEERKVELNQLLAKGIIPVQHDLENNPNDEDAENCGHPILKGKVAAVVDRQLPAKQIVDEMVDEAAELLKGASSSLATKANL